MTLDHSHDRCPPFENGRTHRTAARLAASQPIHVRRPTERSNISTRLNPGSAPGPNRKDLSSDCSKDICLPNISGANGCGPSLVRQTETPGLPNMLPLHDVKHPQPPKGRREFQCTRQQTPQEHPKGTRKATHKGQGIRPNRPSTSTLNKGIQSLKDLVEVRTDVIARPSRT